MTPTLDVAVVDDGVLVGILAGQPAPVIEQADRVVTTSLWHYRLCRAVLADDGGPLSRRLVGTSTAARLSLLALPGIDVLGLSTLAVDAARFSAVSVDDQMVRLNALGAEAVAVVMATSATLVLATENPNLRRVVDSLGVDLVVLDR